MDAKLDSSWTMAEHDRSISEAFVLQRSRLRGFIRSAGGFPTPPTPRTSCRRSFYELVEAARLVRPVEQVGAWLFRVARNRISDLFRKKKSANLESPDAAPPTDSGDHGETSSRTCCPLRTPVRKRPMRDGSRHGGNSLPGIRQGWHAEVCRSSDRHHLWRTAPIASPEIPCTSEWRSYSSASRRCSGP